MSWSRIDDTTFQYDDGGVRFFLLLGSEQALMIDSGMQVHNAKDLAREITELPIRLFNTHLDRDHTGSNGQFDEILVNPAELVNNGKEIPSRKIMPVYDGDVIELGGRALTAIALPGHTPGSTALLDRNTGRLFSGDPIQKDGRIFMFGPMRNLGAYIHSLRRLLSYRAEIREIYPSHATCPIGVEVVDELIEGALKLERGEIKPEPVEMFGRTANACDIGVSVRLCD